MIVVCRLESLDLTKLLELAKTFRNSVSFSLQDWVVQSLELILLLAGCRFNADSYETIEECQAHCITPETTSPMVRYVGKKAECNLSTKVHSSDTYFPRDGPYFL